jgi:beta-glucosidase
MKVLRVIIIVSVVLLGMVFLAVSHFNKKESTPKPLIDNPEYQNTSLPTEERIDDLLSYMTLEEKIGQMALVEKNSLTELKDLSEYGIGALLSGAGAKPENNTPQGWRTMVENFVNASKESRLGIPILYGVDATHGHANVPGATVFPHAIGLGATQDPELIERVARSTALELKATGINWSYSPNLDMPRDMRWGRTYETFSDDPKLTALLGTAFIRGTQYVEGESTGHFAVLSTPKHYVGVGGMEWETSSNKDFKIDQGTTERNEELLRSEYMVPFKAAVDAGALSIMAGLNSWGDTKLAANSYLLTDVLKGQLDFRGFVVSDWYGVYEISNNDYVSAIVAINAGVDMVMLPFDYKSFIENVTRAVRRNEIREERIDDAVRRILRAKFALGLFDSLPARPIIETVGNSSHRTTAREAVAKSMVLLKNENNVLPLTDSIEHVRIAGSAADNVGRQAGAWTVEWQGIDGNWLVGATSILAGVRARAPEGTVIEYDESGRFADSTTITDVGIAVVSEAPYAEGWGDTEYPTISPHDREIIERLKATSKELVVIIVSGRPLFISDEINTWDALVAAWLPGSEGAGVADVLFGDVPFTGTLPLPWPLRSEQLPITRDGVTKDGTSPLFPRYFSY